MAMEVFIETTAGKTTTLRVLLTDTAAVVKKKLENKEGIPKEEQRLTFAGKELDYSSSVADYGMQQHSTLQLVVRLLGGGQNSSTLARGPRWREGAPQTAQGERRALPLLDGVVGDHGVDAIVSFPGKYQDTWNDMVGTVLLLKHLARKLRVPEARAPSILSTACIFLPDGDKNLGKHRLNTIDIFERRARRCFCHKLYGERKEWGCKWFHVWQGKLEEVLDRGQRPIVVYKAGEVGEGDGTPWEHFPIPFSTEHRGLGGSQKGEVAYLQRRLAERSIIGFWKKDVDGVSRSIEEQAVVHLRFMLKGAAGRAALTDAIEHCKEVQETLGTLSLAHVEVELGEVGGVALAQSLPLLRALRRLVLPGCGLGEAAGQAVAASLKHLPQLTVLNLDRNPLGPEARKTLAANLGHLLELTELHLFDTGLGEAGGQAISASLQQLPKLNVLDLNSNELGKEVGRALGASLWDLSELRTLELGNNKLGEEAGQAIASGLQYLPRLRELCLSSNDLGEEAGKALGANLRHLPELRTLELANHELGEEAGQVIATSLQHLPRLNALKLDLNNLGEVGKVLGANLRHLPELRMLSLSGNRLGEEAGQAIATGLQHLPRLSELHLSRNELGEEAGQALGASLQHLPELRLLALAHNRLGEGAGLALAASLEHLPLLGRLNLRGNLLGWSATSQLRENWGGRRGRLLLDCLERGSGSDSSEWCV